MLTEVTCAGRAEGTMFASPTDCSAYYWCIFGQPLLHACTSGLVFNPFYGGCDWPQNVDCSGRSGPPSTTTQRPATTTQVPVTTQNPVRTPAPSTQMPVAGTTPQEIITDGYLNQDVSTRSPTENSGSNGE